MNSRSFQKASMCLLFISPLAVAPPASAVTGEDLPTAAAVLDRHVEATGGARAHAALRTRRSVGKLAVDMAGHTFERAIERRGQVPCYSHILVDGIKVMANNSEEAWEWQPAASHAGEETGPGEGRLLAGAERDRAIELAAFDPQACWRALVQEARTVGRVELEGGPALEVEILRHRGTRLTQWFDEKTGRLVKYHYAEPVDFGHLGKLDQVAFLEDYREFDGVWLPTRVRHVLSSETFGKGTQTWIYTSIEHNVELPASLFRVPEDLLE